MRARKLVEVGDDEDDQQMDQLYHQLRDIGDEIVTDYPDSRYAEIILNPRSLSGSSGDENSAESLYKSAFICYEEEDYDYALSTVNGALEQFQWQEI